LWGNLFTFFLDTKLPVRPQCSPFNTTLNISLHKKYNIFVFDCLYSEIIFAKKIQFQPFFHWYSTRILTDKTTYCVTLTIGKCVDTLIWLITVLHHNSELYRASLNDYPKRTVRIEIQWLLSFRYLITTRWPNGKYDGVIIK
jgi:hypothetical protein